MGHASSLDILKDYRICLAPLRFGAGLKGKIVDSWRNGLPVVTTPVGAEGMIDQGLYAQIPLNRLWLKKKPACSQSEDARCPPAGQQVCNFGFH